MLGIQRALFTIQVATLLPSNEGAGTGCAIQLTSCKANVTKSTLHGNSPHSGNYSYKMLNGYLWTSNAAKQNEATELKHM